MEVEIKFLFILLISFVFGLESSKGQTVPEKEKTIYLMRAKQFYGSGAKMDLMINGEIFHKFNSGSRLIIKTTHVDTLNIQIIYPIIKSNKSKVLKIAPNNTDDVYIDLFYWGEGYNPIKHGGVIGPYRSTPEFNIEIVEMKLEDGKKKFNQDELYKDNKKIIEKKFESK